MVFSSASFSLAFPLDISAAMEKAFAREDSCGLGDAVNSMSVSGEQNPPECETFCSLPRGRLSRCNCADFGPRARRLGASRLDWRSRWTHGARVWLRSPDEGGGEQRSRFNSSPPSNHGPGLHVTLPPSRRGPERARAGERPRRKPGRRFRISNRRGTKNTKEFLCLTGNPLSSILTALKHFWVQEIIF